MDVRDSLDIETVSAALVTSGRPWRGVEFHPALGSTNTRLRELLTGTAEQPDASRSTGPYAAGPYAAGRRDDDAGLWWVVLTDHQTGGRGRLGRAWTVPDRASLAVSVAVPVVDPTQAGWMPLLAGLALSRAVRRVTEATGAALTARLKWPNDVLLADDGDRKLSGILCELVTVGSVQAVVVGTGVDVDEPGKSCPSTRPRRWRSPAPGCAGRSSSSPTSTSSGPSDRAGVGTDASDGSGAAEVRTAYREACSTIGLTVRVHLPTGVAVEGTAVGVDDDGALVVRTNHGVRTFAAGDVVHVRPAAGGLA